jgi:hypothetical protein
MDDFLPALHTHFSDTVPALLALSRFGNKLDIKELSRREGERDCSEEARQDKELPAMLCSFDITFEEGKCISTEAPGVSGCLARNWYVRSKKGWWEEASRL